MPHPFHLPGKISDGVEGREQGAQKQEAAVIRTTFVALGGIVAGG